MRRLVEVAVPVDARSNHSAGIGHIGKGGVARGLVDDVSEDEEGAVGIERVARGVLCIGELAIKVREQDVVLDKEGEVGRLETR